MGHQESTLGQSTRCCEGEVEGVCRDHWVLAARRRQSIMDAGASGREAFLHREREVEFGDGDRRRY